jgi:hypothetical protein
MSELLIDVQGGKLSVAQAEALLSLVASADEPTHWHFNDCGCCVTLHGSHDAYVIGRDGESTLYAMSCECELHS